MTAHCVESVSWPVESCTPAGAEEKENRMKRCSWSVKRWSADSHMLLLVLTK